MMVGDRYQQAVTQERKIVLQIKKLVEGGILEIEATGRWLQTTAELSPIFSSPHHLSATSASSALETSVHKLSSISQR